MENKSVQLSEGYNNLAQQVEGDPKLLLLFIGIPLLYVIICAIIGKSSEKRAFFYSYFDVSLAYIVPVISILLLFVGKISNETKLLIILATFIVVAICMLTISYRANQGDIFITLFTWSGKIVFIFFTVMLFVIAILLAGLGVLLAVFIKEQFGRQKYERKAKYRTKEARYAGAGLGFGLGMVCAITTFGVKYHDFSLPPKLERKKLIDQSTTENME